MSQDLSLMIGKIYKENNISDDNISSISRGNYNYDHFFNVSPYHTIAERFFDVFIQNANSALLFA